MVLNIIVFFNSQIESDNG